MLQNQDILGIQNPITSYVRAAERKSSPRFSRQMTRNCCAWNASANQESHRRKHEQESLRRQPPFPGYCVCNQGSFLQSRECHVCQDCPGPANRAAKRHCLRGDVYAMGRPESRFHAKPAGFHGGKVGGKRTNGKTGLPRKTGVRI